eukprot:253642-Prorocentrum_minimum.AAC.1
MTAESLLIGCGHPEGPRRSRALYPTPRITDDRRRDFVRAAAPGSGRFSESSPRPARWHTSRYSITFGYLPARRQAGRRTPEPPRINSRRRNKKGKKYKYKYKYESKYNI